MSKWDGRLIFHIDADAFFASVEQMTNPLLRKKPVLVCGVPLDKGIVMAASYEARRFGIKAGMPVAQARLLLPDGFFVPVNIPKYTDFSLRLFKIYFSYTHRLEPYSIDEVFLDLTGECNDPEQLARALKTRVLRETGLMITVGIGPNKLLAKIGTELGKPNGLFVIRPENVQTILAPLSVKLCPGVGAAVFELLSSLGIVSFADLQTVALDKLRKLLGKNGEKLFLAARGVDDSPVIAVAQLPQEKSIGHEITFPEWVNSRDKLEGVIWELAGRVAFQLRGKKLLATGVKIKIKINTGKSGSKSHDRLLAEPTAGEGIIGTTARQIFFDNWNGLAIRGLGVSATGLASQSSAGNQISLFPNDDLKILDLEKAADGLRKKYGEDILCRAVNLLARRD